MRHYYFVMIREFKIISLVLANFAAGALAAFAAEASSKEAPSPDVSGPMHLSVEDVIERVKGQNLELLIQKENVRRALEQAYQRRAELLPQFGLRAQQMRTQLGRGFAGANTNSPPFNSFGSRIEGSLSLIDAERYADFRIAKLSHAIEQLDYEVAVQDLLDQAILLYFTQLRDIRRIEIFQGNLEREQRLLDLAQQQFDAGVAVKIDVTRAEVRLATVKRSLMEAETAADDSILQLKNLLDIDLNTEVVLDRSLVDGVKSPPALKRYGLMADLTELRPELQSQELQLDQAKLAKRAVTWQRLPSLELFADWGYDSNEAFDGEEGEAWMVGIEASIPIWEGGRIAAESREARAAVRQNEYATRQLRNEIERQFKFAMLDMDSRYAQIEIARDEVRLGKDEVDQARERYNEGLADNRELIDAQQRLADAESSHLRAIYLYGLSRLSFARAIGSVERVLE
ncbi:TolC family protein [Coraliomargarita sinensis]|nr:TolC family protein [Coraliomargarita sinensis]